MSFKLNLGDVIDDTLRILSDYRGPLQEGFIWSREEVAGAVKDVYLDLARTSGFAMDTTQIVLVADQYIYDLPDDCIYPIRITTNTTSVYVLRPTSLDKLDVKGYTLDAEGTPYEQYRPNLGYNQIGLFPTATAQDVTDVTVLLTYLRAPDDWVNEPAVPDEAMPVWLIKDIKYGAAAMLLLSKNDRLSLAKQGLYSNIWRDRIRRFIQKTRRPDAAEGMVPT